MLFFSSYKPTDHWVNPLAPMGSIMYTAHKMYFPLLHGEYMEKSKELFVRSVPELKIL
jgi:hypothetical protein